MDAQFDIINTPIAKTIELIAKVLQAQIRNSRPSTPDEMTSFHAKTIPAISIEAYLHRILKYAPCGNEVLLSTIALFNRMDKLGVFKKSEKARRNSLFSDFNENMLYELQIEKKERVETHSFQFNSYNIHRLLVVGVMISTKFWSDIFFTNLHMSRAGGLPLDELNSLELEFLIMHNFDLHVPTEELQEIGNMIQSFNLNQQQQATLLTRRTLAAPSSLAINTTFPRRRSSLATPHDLISSNSKNFKPQQLRIMTNTSSTSRNHPYIRGFAFDKEPSLISPLFINRKSTPFEMFKTPLSSRSPHKFSDAGNGMMFEHLGVPVSPPKSPITDRICNTLSGSGAY